MCRRSWTRKCLRPARLTMFLNRVAIMPVSIVGLGRLTKTSPVILYSGPFARRVSLAAGQNENGDGLVVLDVGRELAVVHVDRSVATEMRAKVGVWIQARSSTDDRTLESYLWHFTEVRRREIGLDRAQ